MPCNRCSYIIYTCKSTTLHKHKQNKLQLNKSITDCVCSVYCESRVIADMSNRQSDITVEV